MSYWKDYLLDYEEATDLLLDLLARVDSIQDREERIFTMDIVMEYIYLLLDNICSAKKDFACKTFSRASASKSIVAFLKERYKEDLVND